MHTDGLAAHADTPAFLCAIMSLYRMCLMYVHGTQMAYIAGLIFTLRTHAHIYDKEKDDDGEISGHDDNCCCLLSYVRLCQ